ncbi:MAG: cell division protein SepF [Firmicutes bacterium]|nr:cell division protein SepF [Bacillota bacterium]MDD4264670.1 cell division protein SepF [Bacillota bacterium]MDD4694756.1 cell division protein SepF [Bacillota bacterium]
MSVMDKILKLLGMQDEEHDGNEMDITEDQIVFEQIGATELLDQEKVSQSMGKTMRMVVLNCININDATQAVNNLKINRPVIVTLADTTKEESQRIIDFISGAVYAMEGELEEISNDTFVFVPKNVVVDKARCEELVKDDSTILFKDVNEK